MADTDATTPPILSLCRDEATGHRLSAAPGSSGSAVGGVGRCSGCIPEDPSHEQPLQTATRTFLDLGCAPGGFSMYLLESGLRGVGATLRPQPGFHAMDRRLDKEYQVKPLPLQGGGVSYPVSQEPWTLHYADLTNAPHATCFEAPGGENFFDLVIAGARFSKSGKSNPDEEGGGTRAVAGLLTSQLLVALRHLKPGGHLVLVLNVTPLLTYCAPLALLREYFGELVACKPASTFEHRSSCYVAALGYNPPLASDVVGQAAPEEVLEVEDPWSSAALNEAHFGEDGGGGSGQRVHPVERLTATITSLTESSGAADEGSSKRDRQSHFPCAPFVDVTPKELVDRHATAVKELMEPLWDYQAHCVQDLLAPLQPASHSGRPGYASGGPRGRGDSRLPGFSGGGKGGSSGSRSNGFDRFGGKSSQSYGNEATAANVKVLSFAEIMAAKKASGGGVPAPTE